MYISPRTSIKRAYESIPKKESRIMLIMGMVLFFTSLALIPSLYVAHSRNEDIWAFVVPLVAGVTISSYMCLKYKLPNDMRPADGLMMMFALWMELFAFGTIPYLMHGISVIDSIFESVSGFSTTGATIFVDVEAQPMSLLIWRAMTNWIGGIIIVMMFMFIIPMVVSGGRGLLKNEMSGSGGGNLYMKMGSAARQFIIMYIILTAIFAGVLLLLGVSLADSVTIAMSSISIGGFLNTNDSMASYSIFVKVSVIIFMTLAASNFYLHYRALFKGDFRGYTRNEEFKTMILWFSAVSLMILLQCFATGVWDELSGNDADRVVDIVFSVVSVGTTSGFSTVDYTTHWMFLDLSLFMVMMFVGGCAGSTSGGVKISRMIITVKSLINEVRQEVHPNAVYTVRFQKEGLTHDVVHTSMVIVVAFLIAVGAGSIMYNVFMDLDNAVYTSVAMITNTGTGSGQWFGNYVDLPIWAKLGSCILMFLGRMEILAILAIFTPGFWLEYMGRAEINKTKSRLNVVGGIRQMRKNRAYAAAEEKDGESDENSEDGSVEPSEEDEEA